MNQNADIYKDKDTNGIPYIQYNRKLKVVKAIK